MDMSSGKQVKTHKRKIEHDFERETLKEKMNLF